MLMSLINQKPMADATEEIVECWVKYLKSSRGLVFALDISAERLSISAQGRRCPAAKCTR